MQHVHPTHLNLSFLLMLRPAGSLSNIWYWQLRLHTCCLSYNHSTTM
jgi:hypothetical protein